MNQDAFSALIGEIYDCAVDPALWPVALEHLAGQLRTCNATIFTQDPLRHNIVFGYDWGSDPAWMGLYAEKFLAINPGLTFGWHAEIDQPGRMQTIMPMSEFRRTRFYKEWCQPQGICDLVLAVLTKSATAYTAITASRLEKIGPTGERELKLMGLLAPHIRRAVSIHGLIDLDASRAADFAEVLDLVATPAFLFDANGACIETNGAADRLIAETGLLRMQGGMLTADDGARAEIARLVAASAAGDPAGATGGGSVVLPEADGRRFVGDVLPLSGGRRGQSGARRRAVAALFIREVGNPQPLPGELLVRLYGLSMAETRLLALLAQGFTPAGLKPVEWR